MNLNNTGRLELDDEVALQVVAVDAAGRPKLDLPPDQCWRGSVLNWYENGTWTMLHLGPEQRLSPGRRFRVLQRELPDFGPDQFFLTFAVQPRRAGGLVLAEPVRFGPRDVRLPVLSLADEGQQRLFAEQRGGLLPVEISDRRQEYRYRQVVPATDDPSRTAAEGVQDDRILSFLTILQPQLQTPLQSWTEDLLRRLSQQPRDPFPKGVRAALAKMQTGLRIRRDEWEATARLLTDYLAHSGEFGYTLEITRQDRSIDPILDFLVNVKQGHCERFAAALTAMLRSVGIPARIVKGFRGWSSEGDGRYVVRHRHAHAWVEILVPRGGLASRLRLAPVSYDWLSLDPTPPALLGSTSGISLTNIWETVQQFCLQWWRALIVEYNGDEQADLWEMLTSSRPVPVLLKLGLAVGAVMAAWLALRRLRRHRRTAAVGGGVQGTALYPRLRRILERYASLRPKAGQTPREFGETAGAVLRTRPALAALAEWPMRVIDLFYRARFGDQPLGEEEHQTLDSEFARFDQALRQSPP